MNTTPRRQILRPASRPQSPSRRELPTRNLLLATVAMAGIQTCYSAQFNLVTSHLLHLHIPVHLVSLAWLAGPLSGLLVQPVIGCLSDRCTHPLGRRRPFLIIGSILTASSMLLFANAENVASLLSRLVPSGPSLRTLALAIAITSFFALDFSVQAVQAPLRALLTDVLPPSQLANGNSCIALFVGLGNLIGSLLAATHLTPFLRRYGIDMTHVHVVFLLCSVILLATVAVTVWSTKEKPLRRAKRSSLLSDLVGDDRRWRIRARLLLKVLRDIPWPFWPVFCVQLCTWCGFFTLFVYLNAWVGKNIYHGQASAAPGTDARKVFEQGVRLGAAGNALMALVTMLYSAVLPLLLDFAGVAPVYVFSQIVEAGCLVAAYFIRGIPKQIPSTGLKLATVLDIGTFGITWATTMSVPWTLIGRALESDTFYAKNYGLFTTLFNASQSFPQLVVAFVAPFIMGAWNDSSVVMSVGGFCALFGAALVILLRIDGQTQEQKQEDLEGQERLLDTAAT